MNPPESQSDAQTVPVRITEGIGPFLFLSAMAVVFHVIVLTIVSAEHYWLFLSVGTPSGLATVAYTVFIARRYVEFGKKIIVQRLLWKRTIDWTNLNEVRHEVLVQQFRDEQYPPHHAIFVRLNRGKMRSVSLSAEEARRILSLAAKYASPGTLVVDRQRYPNERWMKRALIAAGATVGCIASWFAWEMREEIVWGTLSKSWPRVESTLLNSILDTNAERRAGGHKYFTTFIPRAHFSYAVNGATYDGTRIRFGDNTFDTEGSARKQLTQLNTASPLLVHYRPEDPAMSVAIPGVIWYRYLLFAGLVGASIGGFGYAAWAWLKCRVQSEELDSSVEFKIGERR